MLHAGASIIFVSNFDSIPSGFFVVADLTRAIWIKKISNDEFYTGKWA